MLSCLQVENEELEHLRRQRAEREKLIENYERTITEVHTLFKLSELYLVNYYQ